MDSIIFSIDERKSLIGGVIEVLGYTELDISVGDININHFSDGEVCADFATSVRGKRVYLVSTPDSAENVLLLNFSIDAAKRAGAKEIIPIIPYFPYARQDKKDQARGPIGAKVMAEMIENRGATSVITFDLHADQIQGFFNIPVMHMEGKNIFHNYIIDIYNHNTNELVLCAPDAGAAKRVKGFRDKINSKYGVDLPIVMIDKTRIEANKIDKMVIIGDVKNKSVIIIDDMCDTGGTLIKASATLKESGAKDVACIVTHGIFSGPALDRIYNAIDGGIITDFVCSDSLPINKTVVVSGSTFPIIVNTDEFLRTISISEQIVKGIVATEKNISIESLNVE